MELDEKKIPTIFKAFCDENRVKILKLLLTGEKCACVLLDDMHITQPTLSHHMKILCDSGIVIGRKEGKWMHYSISENGVQYAIDCLQALMITSAAFENKSVLYSKFTYFSARLIKTSTYRQISIFLFQGGYLGYAKTGWNFFQRSFR